MDDSSSELEDSGDAGWPQLIKKPLNTNRPIKFFLFITFSSSFFQLGNKNPTKLFFNQRDFAHVKFINANRDVFFINDVFIHNIITQ